DMAFAVRASACLPAFYVPVRDENGRLLVDGGLVANLPVSYARELGADVVIAVDLNAAGATFMEQPKTALGVLAQVFVAVERVVSNQEKDQADFVIVPRVGNIRWDETRRTDELIRAGYEAGIESIPAIKEIIDQRKV